MIVKLILVTIIQFVWIEAVSAGVGLSVTAVMVVVGMVATQSEAENAETAVRMGVDYLHLNLR